MVAIGSRLLEIIVRMSFRRIFEWTGLASGLDVEIGQGKRERFSDMLCFLNK